MLKKLSVIVLGAVLVMGLQGCTASQPDAENRAAIVIQKSPKDTRQYATLTLSNGMEVILVEDTSSEIAAVSLALGVGSFQNPEHQQGLAHYLEHMLFLGTEKYPDPNTLQQFIDHNSGSWNAYTAPDHTNYFFSLPAGKLDEALDMFSDYFKAPRFDLEYSDKERNAVNSEWSMGRSQDGRIINYLNGVTGNPAHPASQLAVGNLDTLSDKPGSVLNEDLVAFFERYYSANIMKLVMVSNKSLAEQTLLATKHFSAIENNNIDKPAVPVTGVTEAQMSKKIHYASVMDLKMIMLRFPMPNNSELWKNKPNEYVNSLLASEEPGTVAQQLREKNLVKSLYAQVDPVAYDYDGSFDVFVDLTDEGMTKRDEVIAAIFAYIELIKREGVDKKYFLEQKAIKEKKFANLDMQQPLKTAIHLSSTLLQYNPEWVISNPYVYSSFDELAVNDVLSYLTPERARIWYISQHERVEKAIPYHEGGYAIEDITRADIAKWRSIAETLTFNLPAENDLFSKEAAIVEASTIKSPTLLKGKGHSEIWLTHSDSYQDQKGTLEFLLNSDLGASSVQNQMLAKILVKVLTSQQLSLIDRAGQAGIGLDFGFNGNDLTVSLSLFNAKHDVLALKVFKALSQWDVSAEEFSKALDSLRQDLDNREKSAPYRQMFGLLSRELLANSWSREAEKQAVESLTREQLVAFHKGLLSANRLRVFAYGNYSEERVLAIVSDVEALLPQPNVDHALFKRAIKTPVAGASTHYKEALTGHTDNAYVQLFIGTEKTYVGKAKIMTLNALTRNAFFTQLRTNEQLGYVVGTAPKVVDQYPGLMFFVQSNNTELPSVSKRIDRFRREFLAELDSIDESVIEQIKRSQLELLTKQPLDFGEEMKPLMADFYDGRLTFDSKQQLIAAFEQVNKASLIQLYRDLILGNAGQKIVVQLKGTGFADTAFAPN